MGYIYEFSINSINDFFVQTLLDFNEDITKPAVKEEIKGLLLEFLIKYVDESELEYLDYDIKKNKYGYKVVANNFASALFFNNVIPNSFSIINKQKDLEFNGFLYIFDEKKKKLNIKRINNGQTKRT